MPVLQLLSPVEERTVQQLNIWLMKVFMDA